VGGEKNRDNSSPSKSHLGKKKTRDEEERQVVEGEKKKKTLEKVPSQHVDQTKKGLGDSLLKPMKKKGNHPEKGQL